MSKKTEYERFLYTLYKNLYVQSVHATARKYNVSEEEAAKRVPGFQERIRYYLERMQTLFELATTEQQKAMLKGIYFERLVIKKENLPCGMSDAEKGSKINQQRKTLGQWLDYLLDPGVTYTYPSWFKYWFLREVINLGSIDELTGKYKKRTPETYEPFLDFDPVFMDYCAQIMIPKVEALKNAKETRKAANDIRFKDLLLDYKKGVAKRKKEQTEGKWVKYEMGREEEAQRLYDSLQGKGTGWCTEASLETAKTQVKNGDFYVYYSKDQNGKYTNPRIAIRLLGKNSLDGGEIRGIDHSQNLEEEMIDILEKQLKEMSFLEPRSVREHMRKIKDLRTLSEIKQKTLNHQILTADELLLLYTGRFGFGHEPSKLQERVINRRNIQEDWRRLQEMGEDAIAVFFMNRKTLDDNGLKITNHDLIERLIVHKRSSIALHYATTEALAPHKEEIRSLLQRENILIADMSAETQSWYLKEIIEILEKNPRYLEFIHAEVQDQIVEDIIRIVGKDIELYQYLSPRILELKENQLYTDAFWKFLEKHPEKTSELLSKMPKQIQITHQQEIGKIIKQSGFYIQYVCEEVLNLYPEVLIEAVNKNIEFLEDIPTSVIERHPEIIIEIVKAGNFTAFYHAPASLKRDREVIAELVKKHPRIITGLTTTELLNLGLEFMLTLIRINARVLRDLPGSIQVKYPILVMEAVSNTPEALKYISEEFQEEQKELYQNLLKMYPQEKKEDSTQK